MNNHDEFHAEIKRLTEEVEHYQEKYDIVCKVVNQQAEIIKNYADILTMQEAEIEKLKGEL